MNKVLFLLAIGGALFFFSKQSRADTVTAKDKLPVIHANPDVIAAAQEYRTSDIIPAGIPESTRNAIETLSRNLNISVGDAKALLNKQRAKDGFPLIP